MKDPITGRSVRYADIYRAVRRIPRGKVATYGQVARVAGIPGRARMVGYALAALPEGSTVPWHRVVNAKGRVSARSNQSWGLEQRLRLELEGVPFRAGSTIDLSRHGWKVTASQSRKSRKES